MCAVVRYYNRVYVACLRCFGSRWGVPQCFPNLQNLKPTNTVLPVKPADTRVRVNFGDFAAAKAGDGVASGSSVLSSCEEYLVEWVLQALPRQRPIRSRLPRRSVMVTLATL